MGNKSKTRKHLHPVQTPVQTPGNGHEHPSYDVGAVVPVPTAAFDKLAPGLGRITDLQRQLGAMTEDFEMKRTMILRALMEQRQAYSDQVKQTGIEMGLNLGPESSERWMFDPAKKVFARQG